mgnify:CR=1 FL=1
MELFTKNKKQRIIKAGGNKNPQSAVLLPAFYLSVIYFVRPAAFYIDSGDDCWNRAAVILYIYLDGVKKMNYTYMVQCADGSLYTGWTNSLEKRLKAHNEGKDGAKYTKAKRPVHLAYYEGFATREEAMRRECEIKKLTRKQKDALRNF